jgi:hypothetical protein
MHLIKNKPNNMVNFHNRKKLIFKPIIIIKFNNKELEKFSYFCTPFLKSLLITI